MHIFETLRFEARRQGGVVELRVMARAGDRSDIHEALYSIGLQQRQKRVDRQGRVPESEDGTVRPMHFLGRMFAHFRVDAKGQSEDLPTSSHYATPASTSRCPANTAFIQL